MDTKVRVRAARHAAEANEFRCTSCPSLHQSLCTVLEFLEKNKSNPKEENYT